MDLAILVPSRGRPGNVTRLADACAQTCRTNYVLAFGFDDDDMASIPPIAHGMESWVRPRMGLTAWTNELAGLHPDAPYLASLGDDMVPVTDGWDERLITAVEHMGGGFAYPDDRRRNDIPEAVVVDARIVKELKWFALPALEHWFIDNVWADLGRGAGDRLRWCPEVIVEHRHPNVTGGPSDPTYHEAAGRFTKDAAAYRRWRLYDMPRDIRTVKGALS